MLVVQGSEALMACMKTAKETGTEDQLINWLLWLDQFGNGATMVELRCDIPTSPTSMCWYAHHIHDGQPDEQVFYNGGLIFHRSANEWSIHS